MVDAPRAEASVLVVEDQRELWELTRRACRPEKWELSFHVSAEEALAGPAAEPERLDAAVVDLQLPGMSGVDLLARLHAADPFLPVLVVTGQGDADSIVRCMKAGAYDYLVKPFRNEDLVHRLRRAIESRRQLRRLSYFESEEYLASVMGPSEAVARLARMVAQVGPSDLSVLVEGESGTGKELLARRIHALSRRAAGPFVAVDCGAIPETLIESELFGFKKGSFTGAVADRRGKFEAANGGTLFLDELGNLPLSMQAKLLRALQEREVTPIGADRPVPVDFRVVAATNTSLSARVEKEEFRLDLFHRLAEFPIQIPPLRERTEDLLYLATRFLAEARQELGKEVAGFSEKALEELLAHRWPGNVRELKSAIRRSTLVSEGRIESLLGGSAPAAHPSAEARATRSEGGWVVHVETVIPDEALESGSFPYKTVLKRLTGQLEKAVLASVLSHVGGNKSRASKILGLDYKTVHTKAKEYGIG